MRLISKSLLSFFLIFIILLFYLSIFGIETDKFNNQISNKIKGINNEISVELKKIKLVLDPFALRLNIKTIGSKLKNQNQIIEIENIKTQISLRSLIGDKSSIENMEISTKSVDLRDLISFLRSLRNSPELFFLEKIIKKGFLIADIKLEFDTNGKIKNNYKIDGFIKDAKLSFLRNYKLDNLNLIFGYEKNRLSIKDSSFLLNDLSFKSNEILLKRLKDEFLITGNVYHNKLSFDEKRIKLFINPYFPNLELKKLNFNSNNNFSFKINKKLKIKNLEINSEIKIDELMFVNKFNLKEFFPKVRENFLFSDNKISVNYKNNDLKINGKGNILYQENNDILSYTLIKKNKDLDFNFLLDINDNPFLIDFLNYEKNLKNKTSIKIIGSRNTNNKVHIDTFELKEANNEMYIKKIVFNEKFQIIDLKKLTLDYFDKEMQKNLIELNKENNEYFLEGSSFNANNLINDLLDGKDNPRKFKIDTKISIKLDKIYLDNEYNLSSFSGNIFFKNNKILKANLEGSFSNNEKLKFTINSLNNNKITTLFVDRAEPIIKRYKFVKGFGKGSLDFYSSKELNETKSTLKIYDFKLKELPILTKILTLASLQGIADILTGEGISFDEFEMNFKNKDNLITIEEIYAIGPAISILMEGYVEKNKLISLRGTLVPATTINKFIGSLPVLGKILVGSKTGEGVFGVSFKIKGPPKKLETSVNPIKTLTPRFITRTLEKIKKN